MRGRVYAWARSGGCAASRDPAHARESVTPTDSRPTLFHRDQDAAGAVSALASPTDTGRQRRGFSVAVLFAADRLRGDAPDSRRTPTAFGGATGHLWHAWRPFARSGGYWQLAPRYASRASSYARSAAR
jgi:hypothetical protein